MTKSRRRFKRIRTGTQEMPTPWLTVVGEVADVKLRSPDGDTQEEFYQVEDQAEASIDMPTQFYREPPDDEEPIQDPVQ